VKPVKPDSFTNPYRLFEEERCGQWKQEGLPTAGFHTEITRSKLDRLDKLLFGASHGLVLILWVTWL